MKNEVETVLAFSRKDVEICGLNELEVRMLDCECVHSQTEDGPIKLRIGARASDAQLQRAATRCNVPFYDLVSFRDEQRLLLVGGAPTH